MSLISSPRCLLSSTWALNKARPTSSFPGVSLIRTSQSWIEASHLSNYSHKTTKRQKKCQLLPVCCYYNDVMITIIPFLFVNQKFYVQYLGPINYYKRTSKSPSRSRRAYYFQLVKDKSYLQILYYDTHLLLVYNTQYYRYLIAFLKKS